jgi:hypothetical protein
MIIADLPCLVIISDHDEIIGGKQNITYNNTASAVATASVRGGVINFITVDTSAFTDTGVSKSLSLSMAISLG